LDARRQGRRIEAAAVIAVGSASFVWLVFALFQVTFGTGLASGTPNVESSNEAGLMIAVVGLILTGLTGISVAYINRALSEISEMKERIESHLQLDARLKLNAEAVRAVHVASLRAEAHMEALNEIGAARQGSNDVGARQRVARLNEIIRLFSTEEPDEVCQILSIVSRDVRLATVMGACGWNYVFALEHAYPDNAEISRLVISVKALAPQSLFQKFRKKPFHNV
jgi:hypothetical protein